LRYDWGNIGYGIRPSERKKWYTTIWLKLVLEKCKELWIDKVMLTCNKENIWSSKAIIKNWWVRNSEYEHEGKIKDRYYIPIK
jgi:predicted acetyltransferase